MNDSILASNNLYSQFRQKYTTSGSIAMPKSTSDLSRSVEAKVALHLFDRRGDPSFSRSLSK